MTEYDFSMEAINAHMEKQARVALWTETSARTGARHVGGFEPPTPMGVQQTELPRERRKSRAREDDERSRSRSHRRGHSGEREEHRHRLRDRSPPPPLPRGMLAGRAPTPHPHGHRRSKSVGAQPVPPTRSRTAPPPGAVYGQPGYATPPPPPLPSPYAPYYGEKSAPPVPPLPQPVYSEYFVAHPQQQQQPTQAAYPTPQYAQAQRYTQTPQYTQAPQYTHRRTTSYAPAASPPAAQVIYTRTPPPQYRPAPIPNAGPGQKGLVYAPGNGPPSPRSPGGKQPSLLKRVFGLGGRSRSAERGAGRRSPRRSDTY
ncbi:hypothetical protein MKEN_00751500 [Mycena kentingensis (nom. inval.)]|nr:hypothetical protein MKEN_00751500 [Mycena kentingensis (nom. inval.)]